MRYSRSGFLSAIDDYEIGALECLFLPEDKIVKESIGFNIRSFDKTSVDFEVKRMVKKVITKASNSWFLGNRDVENERFEKAEKAYFHAIRILMFGLQIKNNKKIVDFTEANYIWEQMLDLEEPLTYKKVKEDFLPLRDELMEELRK